MIFSKLFALALLLGSTQAAQAMDHRSQWGVGASLGGAFAAPWAQREFENRVGAGPVGSAWFRYVPGTPEVGFQVSYDYFQLSKMEMKTNALIMTFFSRQNPWGSFHPFYSFGVGWQKTTNFFSTGEWETPIFKIQAGVEFELNERVDIGFVINHYTIFHNRKATGNAATDEATAHVLAPTVSISYYFGTPAPMPAPAPPTPVPTPVAIPAPAPAPVVAQPEDVKPAPMKPAPSKAKTRPSKVERKKPAPKKKNR